MSDARRGANRAADPAALLGVVADHVDAEADLLLGVRDGLALFSGQQIGDVVEPLDDQIRRAAQNSGASVRMRGGPAGQRPSRGVHRVGDVAGVSDRRRADRVAGCGVEDREATAEPSAPPRASDEEFAIAHRPTPHRALSRRHISS